MPGVLSVAYAPKGVKENHPRVHACAEEFASDPELHVRELYLHLNAEAHNQNDSVRGFSAVLGDKAVMNIDYMNPRMFGYIMAFRIGADGGKAMDNGELVSSKLAHANTSQAKNLNSIVRDATKNPPSLSAAAFGTDPSAALSDKAKWTCALGAGGRIGLYKEEVEEDQFSYFLLVQVDGSAASQDLYDWVYEQEPGSLRVADFFASKEFKYVEALNRRNARRLAVKAASALGVTLVDGSEPDMHAYVTSEFEERPVLAKPVVENQYNTIRGGKWDGKDAYFVYDHVTCASKAKGGVVLMQHPRDSVLLFPLEHQHTPGETRVLINEAAASFPVFAGRPAGEVECAAKAANLPETAKKSINKRLTWEGKYGITESWAKSRLAPDYYVKIDLARNNHQRKILAALYDNDLSSTRRLQPVIVKISAE